MQWKYSYDYNQISILNNLLVDMQLIKLNQKLSEKIVKQKYHVCK